MHTQVGILIIFRQAEGVLRRSGREPDSDDSSIPNDGEQETCKPPTNDEQPVEPAPPMKTIKIQLEVMVVRG